MHLRHIRLGSPAGPEHVSVISPASTRGTGRHRPSPAGIALQSQRTAQVGNDNSASPALLPSVFSQRRSRRCCWRWSACCSACSRFWLRRASEEPQINVTFRQCSSRFPAPRRAGREPGASPAEQVLDEMIGESSVYSTSMPGMAILTVQYLVGQDRTDAIVRLCNRSYQTRTGARRHRCRHPDRQAQGYRRRADRDRHLWSTDPSQGTFESAVAHAIESELKRVPGTRDIYTIGATDNVVAVGARPAGPGGAVWTRVICAMRCRRRTSRATTSACWPATVRCWCRPGVPQIADEIGDTVVGIYDGKAGFPRIDVASDAARCGCAVHLCGQVCRSGRVSMAGWVRAVEAPGGHPLAIAKKPGTNAVEIAGVIDRFSSCRASYIPDGGIGVQVRATTVRRQTPRPRS